MRQAEAVRSDRYVTRRRAPAGFKPTNPSIRNVVVDGGHRQLAGQSTRAGRPALCDLGGATALMSLNMLIEFGDAFDYTASNFFGWCREVGFREFAVIKLAGPSSAAERVQVSVSTMFEGPRIEKKGSFRRRGRRESRAAR